MDIESLEKVHPLTVVSIQTNHPSQPHWRFLARDLTEEELNDMVTMIRTVVENYRPTMES